MSAEHRQNWKEWLVKEFKNLFVTVVYLSILLTVFQLHRAMILSSHGISYDYGRGLLFAVVNALVLGKFMIIAEALHVGKRWHSRPLLHSILFKSAVFALILLACHLLEGLLVAAWHVGSLALALREQTLKETFSLGVVAFVVLIPFFAAKEMIRVVGKTEMKSLLLSREPHRATLQTEDIVKT